MPDYGNGDHDNLHTGGKLPRTESHMSDSIHNTTPQRAQSDTITSEKKVAETRGYQTEMASPKRGSLEETPEMKASRLKTKYPLADTSPVTGTKKKKF